MSGMARRALAAGIGAAIVIAMPAAGQSDASKVALQWSISEACGENMECLTAVEEQFEDCLVNSPYEEFLNAETEEQETYYLALTMQALAACITDDQGEPYFRMTNKDDEASANEVVNDAP